jgi:chromate reductase
MRNYKIGVIIGSLRKDSFNLKMAHTLESIVPVMLDLEILKIDSLPFYNEDLESNPPVEWTDFRKSLAHYDGFIFVTPEYNRSLPAVLKNALDVGSRPYGKNCWNGKPGAIITVSIGAIGGFGANHHLRQVLTFLNVPTMQQPEAYIGNAAGLFNEEGLLTNESTMTFLENFMSAYFEWIDRNAD